MQIADMAQIVGTLLQDPERQIVASNVFNEVAFGPENLGLPPGRPPGSHRQATVRSLSGQERFPTHSQSTDQSSQGRLCTTPPGVRDSLAVGRGPTSAESRNRR